MYHIATAAEEGLCVIGRYMNESEAGGGMAVADCSSAGATVHSFVEVEVEVASRFRRIRMHPRVH